MFASYEEAREMLKEIGDRQKEYVKGLKKPEKTFKDTIKNII